MAFRDQSSKRLVGPVGKSGQFNPRQAGCRLVVDDGLNQKVATLAGAGISMNSLWSIHRELADGSLVRVFIDFLLERIGKPAVWEGV